MTENRHMQKRMEEFIDKIRVDGGSQAWSRKQAAKL